jgi:hypothetical protein
MRAIMASERVQLHTSVAGLEALGFSGPAELYEPPPTGGAPGAPGAHGAHAARGREIARGRTRERRPLPGTPERCSGPLTGRPGGAGTGWIVLERWSTIPLRERLEARFTTPCSGSPAERAWNLLCHLRAHGIGTPEPLAVGARGAGLVAHASFLVTRELEGFEPLDAWLARATEPEVRRRGVEALARAFARLRHARVFLPRIERSHVLLSSAEAGASAFGLGAAAVGLGTSAGGPGASACGLGAGPARPAGMVLRRLPSVAIADVAGGVIRRRSRADELGAMLRRLARPADGPPIALELGEERHFLARALAGLAHDEARSVLRSLDAPR